MERDRRPLGLGPGLGFGLGLLALAALAACACGPLGERGDARPDVVVLLIDTLRADRLQAYGHPAPTSPHIDALAGRSVLFEHAYAPAPWTLPSVVSIFTSRFVPEHGVVRDGQRLAPDVAPLAERFRDAGYATASFVANPYAGASSGLDRGFAEHELTDAPVPRALAWLREPPAGPFLLYVHTKDPHDPFTAHPAHVRPFGEVSRETRLEIWRASRRYRQLTRVDWEAGRPVGTVDNQGLQRMLMERLDAHREPYATLYQGAVRQADAGVGALVRALAARGRLDGAVVAVLSDHGEEMGEHGGWQHDQSVYEELVRVPLLLKLPGDRHAGRRVAQPVSLVDLAPTLAELAGLAPDPRARGRSLLPLLRGEDAEVAAGPRVTAVRLNRKKYYRPFAEQRGDLNLVVRDGRWKAIWNAEPDRVELYDLAADPDEREDLAARHPDVAARLRTVAAAELDAFLEDAVAPAGGEGPAADEETRRMLEALGYLSTEEEEAAREAADGGDGAPLPETPPAR